MNFKATISTATVKFYGTLVVHVKQSGLEIF